MAHRRSVGSNAPWESIYGYSRAVRVGNAVFVSGTTATGADGELVGPGDPYAQAAQALRNILEALDRVGAGARDNVRTRAFVTDIDGWKEIARAHREIFGEFRPAATLVEVARLVDPQMLVEIEADALIDGDDG